MRNYSLVANTQYKAPTFDEMLKPYLMYTEAYREQENALSDLATKADVWEGLANEQTDPVAYAQYKNYADAIKEQAKVIADRGLDSSSRQAMLNLKRRYASEITPIEQAFATRKAQADEQRKALNANPTLMLSRRADTTSLDSYLDNPNLGYDSYSGALLTQQVGQAATALSKELRDYGRGKPLDGFTKTWLQQHGYSAAEVAFAINNPNDPRASNVLNTIVNNVMADSGMAKWADANTLNQAYSYARQGLWQAVGQTQVGTYTDEAAKLAAQEAMQRRLAAEKAGKDKDKPTPLSTAKYNHRIAGSAKDIEKVTSDFDKYKKYFYIKNGNVHMTYEGRQLYRKQRDLSNIRDNTDNPNNISVSSGKKGKHYSVKESEEILKNTSTELPGLQFAQFVLKHGLLGTTMGMVGPGQTASYNRLKKIAAKDYDANISNEFTMEVHPENYKGMISRIAQLGDKDGNIANYDYVNNKGQIHLEKSNDKIDGSKINTDNVKGARVAYGLNGVYLEVDLKDGGRVRIPYTQLTSRLNNTVMGNLHEAAEIEKLREAGKTEWVEHDGRRLPISLAIQNRLNDAGDDVLKAFGLTKVKDEQTDQEAQYE